MFLQPRLLGFIGLLSSLSFVWQSTSVGTNDLQLGTAFMSSVSGPVDGPGEIITGVVVRVSDSKDVQSFGITNDAGVLEMPLPPGRYCWDAFSGKGQSLRMNRQASDRCFTIRPNRLTEVTIGLGVHPEIR